MKIKDALIFYTHQLKTYSDTPRLDCELIINHVTDYSCSYMYTWPEKEILNEHIDQIKYLISLRRQGKSIAHITQKADFWDLTFTVNEYTLAPRSDTETIIEFILNRFDINNKYSILDLGTGTGAIAITLAHLYKSSHATATDISTEALSVAHENAKHNHTDNITFVKSDWFSELNNTNKFDIIISNPPYIDIHDDAIEINVRKHEPSLALFSTNNGLYDLFIIIEESKNYLNHGGTLVLEHGHKQGKSVLKKLLNQGYSNILHHYDINGIHRVTSASR